MESDSNWHDWEERQVAHIAVRVSKVRGKDEDARYSTKLQLEDGRRYCTFKTLDLNEEASLANADEDVSGFRKPWRQRPGLMRHYEAAKRGEFQHLVFFKLSRLGRNVKDSLDLIDSFEKVGVTIHIAKENIDAAEPSGRFLRTVLLAAAEMEAEGISTFIQGAIEQRAKAGKVQHGALPIWLTRKSGGEGYEVIPEQVIAIQKMVQLRMSGMGYVKIARHLNQEGFRTINGKHFTDGMVYKYLTPSWIDTMRGTGFLNRHGESGTKTRHRIERTVIPNLFPAILSEDEANALRVVQSRYARPPMGGSIQGGSDWMTNRRKSKGRRHSATTQFLLSGLVYCACCGERLYSATQSEETRVCKHKYLCIRARTNAESHIDGGVSISGWSLEDAVLRLVRQVLQEPPAPRPKQSPEKIALWEPTRERKELTRRSDLLMDMMERGKISQEDFDRRYARIQAERQAVDDREAEESAPTVLDAAVSILSKSDENQKVTREQLRQLILLMVQRVDAPVQIEGEYVRGPKTGLRRFARVTLHLSSASGHTEFLVPLYSSRFTGTKEAPRPIC